MMYNDDIASRWGHKKSNLMFTLSSDKDQRKIFAFVQCKKTLTAHSYRAKAEAKIVFDVCHLLPPANEVCDGYVFTPVCQSFCSQGGLPHCMLGCTPPDQRQTPHPTPSRTRGRHSLGPEADPHPLPQDQRQAPPPPRPEAGTPRPGSSACWEIRATSGRYA